jgi:DNA-binding beta-propeller fold protein YncE
MHRLIVLLGCSLLVVGTLGSLALQAQVNLEFVGFWYVEGPPRSVAVHDLSGEVLVNINQNYRVLRYSADGELLVAFGREGEIPVGIAVDLEGNSVVAVNINNNYRAVRYDPFGEVLAEWEGTGEPQGIAVDEGGNSVVAVNINNNYRVVRYDPFGEVLAEWEGTGEPQGIAVDEGGNSVVAVNINNNYRVVTHGPSGEVHTAWNGEGAPVAIAVDLDGNVLVVASITSVLHIFKHASDGALLGQWPLAGGVIETNGLAVGPTGEIFVTADQAHRLLIYSTDGELLGEIGAEGSEPGQFAHPQGIAVSSIGLLYIADSGNHRIQVLHWSGP